MLSEKLASIPEVEIDQDGTFKYVLIRVYSAKKSSSSEEVKTIVRGFKWGEYHGKSWNTFYNTRVYSCDCFVICHGNCTVIKEVYYLLKDSCVLCVPVKYLPDVWVI
jgi:hypothetical protein